MVFAPGHVQLNLRTLTQVNACSLGNAADEALWARDMCSRIADLTHKRVFLQFFQGKWQCRPVAGAFATSILSLHLTLDPLYKLIDMFESEAACHAAVREGGPELTWRSKRFTDEDAQWIASALANHEVHRVNTQSDSTTAPMLEARRLQLVDCLVTPALLPLLS